MRNPHVALPSTQRGVTLILALLILVMIMMYGIPAAMDSMQNERMTGNTRNRDLAFQAAEHAIKKAEAWFFEKTSTELAALAPATVTTCSPGNTDPDTADCVFPDGQCHANDAAYWQAYNWNANTVCVMTGLGNQLDTDLSAAQPRYVVERMPDVNSHPYYRITAWGVGKDSNATVILQTMYMFE